MKCTIVHLSGSQRGKTEYFDRNLIRLGSDPASNDLIFDSARDPGVAPQHAELSFDERLCDFILSDSGSAQGVFVNHRQITEIILQDDDLIELGVNGPKLRFRIRPEDHALCKPFREILSDSKDIAAHARRGRIVTTTLFLKQMLKDAATESTRTFKLVMTVVIGLLSCIILLMSYQIYASKRVYERKLARLSKQIEVGNTATRRLEQKIAKERARFSNQLQDQQGTIENLRAELARKEKDLRTGLHESREKDLAEIDTLRKQIATLESSRSFAEDIIRKYGSSVCFIHGAYTFVEKTTGRALRFVATDLEGTAVRDREGRVQVTLEGDGPQVLFDYTGTGFLVDNKKGIVMTNRHLVEPWGKNELSVQFIALGCEPKPLFFRAYFPGIKNPFNLHRLRVAKTPDADVALAKIDLGAVRLPALPLAYGGKDTAPGQPVVLLGYPAGFDVLLALADQKTSQEILQRTGAESEKMAQELANRNLIRPISTQGHLSQILPQQIVYDAKTAVGGSGGPLFNRRGEVIGVNYAILREFSGSNFGVPIKYGIALLRSGRSSSLH